MLCLKVDVEPVNSSTATEKRECKSCQQVCSYNYAPAPKLALNKALFHINCINWMLGNLFVDQDLQIWCLFISWSTHSVMHWCFLFILFFIPTLLSLFIYGASSQHWRMLNFKLSSFFFCNTNKWYLLSKNFFNEYLVLSSFLVSTSSDIVLAIPHSVSPHLDQYMFLMLNQVYMFSPHQKKKKKCFCSVKLKCYNEKLSHCCPNTEEPCWQACLLLLGPVHIHHILTVVSSLDHSCLPISYCFSSPNERTSFD